MTGSGRGSGSSRGSSAAQRSPSSINQCPFVTRRNGSGNESQLAVDGGGGETALLEVDEEAEAVELKDWTTLMNGNEVVRV